METCLPNNATTKNLQFCNVSYPLHKKIENPPIHFLMYSVGYLGKKGSRNMSRKQKPLGHSDLFCTQDSYHAKTKEVKSQFNKFSNKSIRVSKYQNFAAINFLGLLRVALLASPHIHTIFF